MILKFWWPVLLKDEALDMLWNYPNHLTWINALNSMLNAQDVNGIQICLSRGDTGRLVFRNQ